MTLQGPEPADGSAPLTLEGDAELLRQAVVNLLENAVRHCLLGATIRLGVGRDERGVHHVTVADDGPGIPENERERVFDRLYRIPGRVGNGSGNGLGLTLVRAVARLHDGSVTLHDAEPGLEARLRFPATTVGRSRMRPPG